MKRKICGEAQKKKMQHLYLMSFYLHYRNEDASNTSFNNEAEAEYDNSDVLNA